MIVSPFHYGRLGSAPALVSQFRLCLLGPPHQCARRVFRYDTYGDHLQTCQTQSASLPSHDWVACKIGALLGSVGHKVKIHNITPATGKERGDVEVKDYVVLQKPQEQDNRLPPPRTLIMDFTMTHVRFRRSHLQPSGQLPNTWHSDGAPQPHGALIAAVRSKIQHYRRIYLDRPDPIAFYSVLSISFFARSSGGICSV
jgi:hypothetical protein